MPKKLDEARQLLQSVERRWAGRSDHVTTAFPVGIKEIDGHLSAGGIEAPAIHEVYGQVGHGAAGLFATQLALPFLQETANFFLIAPKQGGNHGRLYPPALDSKVKEKLMIISPSKGKDALWAFEECVASGQTGIVMAEVPFLDLTASRRLQLASERGQCLALALCQNIQGLEGTSAARTRWLVRGHKQGWSLKLVGGRGVRPGHWIVEHHAATSSLSLVSPVGDGPLQGLPPVA